MCIFRKEQHILILVIVCLVTGKNVNEVALKARVIRYFCSRNRLNDGKYFTVTDRRSTNCRMKP